MKTIFSKIRDIWKATEVRNKILFIGLIILIYRFGAAIPVPYVNNNVIEGFDEYYGGTIFEYMNILSGGALSQATLFALSISPYITATIVMQLLCVAFTKLQQMSQDEEGKKKINQITRLITVGLGFLTAFAYYRILETNNWLYKSNANVFKGFVVVACFGAGAAIIMWLCEKINEKGIGNGISMILFANIVASGPSIGMGIWKLLKQWPWWTIVGVVGIIVGLAMILFIVFVTNSERRIPVSYAKKVVGRKMYGGQNTNLPLKLNMSGVMPIIFASSIVSLPATIGALFGKTKNSGGFIGTLMGLFESTSVLYIVLYIVLIIAFSYFYIMISFDPVEVSNNLKRNGGAIPGIRPGQPTSDFIKKILNRVTLIGAIFLTIVAGLPLIVNCVANAFKFTGLSSLAFGGSSLLIVVGVALETARDIEAQMSMRHYKGFLQ